MQTHWNNFINNVRLRRICVLLLIISVVYFCRDLMTTVLLTFIFTLLVTKLVVAIWRRLKIPTPILVIIIYALLVGLIAYAAINYLPTIADQAAKYTKQLVDFYQHPRRITNPQIREVVIKLMHTVNVPSQIQDSLGLIWTYVTSIGTIGLALFMSLLLSFFFTLELKQTKQFSEKFLDSTFGWFFQDLQYFGNIFIKTFGVVLEAQFFIAICNTVITTICLAFMQMPELALFSIMIFFLSLIPVAGVIVSMVPLAIAGYAVGGLKYILYIVIIILVVHAIEAYILNPKFMSARTELPIFYTFVVLLIGEHFLGTWGLIVSVPIFTFFLDVFGVQKVDQVHQDREKNPGFLTKLLKKFGK
ncbi:AI-2E family transporter [Fructilactobacillus frigidiflavus]|uniref:AI-2E family transporter n=1 Tax=Fructilactobacillus frigidiflavus TaxID=3242688 RepID=UPI00375808BD